MIKFLTLGIILLLSTFSLSAQDDDGISCLSCPPEEVITNKNIHELRYYNFANSFVEFEISDYQVENRFQILYTASPYLPEKADRPPLIQYAGLDPDRYYFDFTTISVKDASAIAFSPDAMVIASGDQDGKITLWDLSDATSLAIIEGIKAPIIDLIFHPGGDFIIALHEPNIIQIYFLDTEESYRLETPDLSHISSIALNSSGSLLAASGEETIHLWDMNDFSSLAMETTDSPIYKLIFHPTQANEFVSIHSNTIRNWFWHNNRLESSTFATLPNNILDAAEGEFNVDGSVLAILYDQQGIDLWDTITGDLLDVPAVQRVLHTDPPSSIEDLKFSPDGKWLIGGGERGMSFFMIPYTETLVFEQYYKCLDCPPQQAITSETIHLLNHTRNSGVQHTIDFAFTPDSQSLIDISEKNKHSPNRAPWGLFSWYLYEDGENKVWYESEILDFNDNLTHITSSPHSNKIATGERTGVIKIWDVDKNSIEDVFMVRESPVTDLKFHPQTDLVISVHEYQRISYDISRYEQHWLKLPFEPDYISNISFNMDGSQMVSGADGSIMLWDAEAWENLGVFEVATNRVDQVSFYPTQTDRLITISGSDVTSWVLQDGDLSKALSFEQSSSEDGQFIFTSSALSPDGSLLIVIYNQREIIGWDTNSGEIRYIPRITVSEDSKKSYYDVLFSPNGMWLIFSSNWGIEFHNVPVLP